MKKLNRFCMSTGYALAIAALLTVIPQKLSAYDFECDGIYYDIWTDSTVAVTYYKMIRRDTRVDMTGSHWESNPIMEPAYSGAVVVPSYVMHEGVRYKVTAVSEYAFKDSRAVTIDLPETLLLILQNAFDSSSQLESVVVHGNLQALSSFDRLFFNCAKLKKAVLPGSYKEMPAGCFENCTSLESFVLSDSLQSISRKGFLNCASLKRAKLPDGLRSIGSYAFKGCSALEEVTIPAGVTGIYDGAFDGCTSLTKITIPRNVKDVYGAFTGCPNIQELSLLSVNPIKVGISSFVHPVTVHVVRGSRDRYLAKGMYPVEPGYEYCNKYTIIDDIAPVPATSIELSQQAFSLKMLEKGQVSALVLPAEASYCKDVVWSSSDESVIRVDSVTGAFTACFPGTARIIATVPDGTGLTAEATVTVEKNPAYPMYGTQDNIQWDINDHGQLTIRGTGAMPDFSYVWIPGTDDHKVSSPWWDYIPLLRSIKVEEGITVISNAAFAHCQYVETVELPSTVTVLRTEAFHDCTNLKEVPWLKQIKGFGKQVFKDCIHLTEVELGTSVSEIHEQMFQGCTALKKAYLPDGCKVDWGMFTDCRSLTDIHLPGDLTKIPNGMFTRCISLTEFPVTDRLAEIGTRAFSECLSLHFLPADKGLTTIRGYAFEGCVALDGHLPEGIQTIEDHAFNEIAFEELVLPSTLKELGSYAFWGMGMWVDITCNAVTPPTILPDYYKNLVPFRHKGTIHVPEGSEAAYQADSYWNRFYIVGPNAVTPLTTADTPTVTYDLNGRIVEHPTSGIYIQNGRKVLIK